MIEPPQYLLYYTKEQINRLQSLPKRCPEIIYFWDQTKPIPKAPHEEAIDVGQTIWRVPHCEDATPCLRPNSLIWLRRSFRLLEPLAALTIQGLPRHTFESLEHLRSGDLSCLAGNACLRAQCSCLDGVGHLCPSELVFLLR